MVHLLISGSDLIRTSLSDLNKVIIRIKGIEIILIFLKDADVRINKQIFRNLGNSISCTGENIFMIFHHFLIEVS